MPKNFAAIRNINKAIAAKKRKIATAEDNKASAPEGSRMEVDQNVNDTAGDDGAMQSDAPGTAGGSNTPTTGGTRGTVTLPIGLPIFHARYTRVYTKQYHLRIFNKLHQRKTLFAGGSKYNIFIPSIHELPVSLATFYMSLTELERLRHKTRAVMTECNVAVHHSTAVLTFETAATTTDVGNNNVGIKLIALDPMVSQYRKGQHSKFQKDVVTNIFHGKHSATLANSATASTDLTGLGAQYMIRNFENPFEYASLQYTSDKLKETDVTSANIITRVNEDYFPINRFISNRVNASIAEGQLSQWSYKPNDGLLFSNCYIDDNSVYGQEKSLFTYSKISNSPLYWKQNKSTLTTGTPPVSSLINVSGRAPFQGFIQTESSRNDTTHWNTFRNLNDPFEIKIDRYSGHGMGSTRLPVMAFGIEPFVSINTSDQHAVAAKAHIDLIVNCSCQVLITEGTDGVDQSRTSQLIEFNTLTPDLQLQARSANGGVVVAEEDPDVTTINLHEKCLDGIAVMTPFTSGNIVPDEPGTVKKGRKRRDVHGEIVEEQNKLDKYVATKLSWLEKSLNNTTTKANTYQLFNALHPRQSKRLLEKRLIREPEELGEETNKRKTTSKPQTFRANVDSLKKQIAVGKNSTSHDQVLNDEPADESTDEEVEMID